MDLREMLAAEGLSEVRLDAMDRAAMKKTAKALGLDVGEVSREVQLVENKGAQYVQTDSFPVPHRSDPKKTENARNLYLRVEAVPQAIADLVLFQEQYGDKSGE
ncbi:unnamed protein product [marine sediment metagenome]|uniref:Uncharacterized protein n=1 Tax=marine sediment metagenome TaxID=412755 RepID=X1CF07_9ZZZZ